jgi:hypothetical protein
MDGDGDTDGPSAFIVVRLAAGTANVVGISTGFMVALSLGCGTTDDDDGINGAGLVGFSDVCRAFIIAHQCLGSL